MNTRFSAQDARPEGPLAAARRAARWDAAVLLALALAAGLLFWQVTVGKHVFFFRDISLYFYPKRSLVVEAIRHFQIPYWTSMASCGEPVLGAYLSAVFYPLSAVYYVLPMPYSLAWFLVLHTVISGAGAYYMLRAWRVGRSGAAFGAFAWAFSPAFASVLVYASWYTSLAWLPWCLLFAKRITGGAMCRGFAWLSITFAMAVLAAQPEPVIFAAVVVVAYAAWDMAAKARKKLRPGWWRPAAVTVGALLTGALLAGVQLVPFVHTLSYSTRSGGLSADEATAWSSVPKNLVQTILPRFYTKRGLGGIHWAGQDWLASVYLGVLVVVLAAWTVFALRRRRNLFFALGATVFWVLSFGARTPVWRVLFHVLPGVSFIRYPMKFYLPAAFAMAILAGFAANDFEAAVRKGRLRAAKELLAVILALAVLFAVSAWAMGTWREALFAKVTPTELLVGGERALAEANLSYDATEWSFARSAGQLVIAAGALAVVLFVRRKRLRRPYGAAALVAALLVDVGLFGAHLNPAAGRSLYAEKPANVDKVPHGLYQSRLLMTAYMDTELRHSHLDPIRDIRFLKDYVEATEGTRFASPEEFLRWLDRTSAPRFSSLERLDYWLRTGDTTQFTTELEYEHLKEAFCPNWNVLYDVPMVNGFEPMMPKWHGELMRNAWGHSLPVARLFLLARMWGTSVVIDGHEGLPGYAFYPMKPEGARVRLVERFEPVADADAVAAVLSGDGDLVERIILTPKDAAAAGAFLGRGDAQARPDESPGTARVVADTGNAAAVEVEAKRRALLFMADSFFPNFAARVDGRPAPLWRANYGYRAVPVEAGRHTVEFVWRPYDFYAGLVVTGTGAVLLCVAALVGLKTRQRPTAAPTVTSPAE